MSTTNSNPSVENLITEATDIANQKIEKNDDRFYIGLTSLALLGLVTLLVLALA
ncbi:hypothetical protein SAMN04488029_2839 [Reichenbachiella faecimaris]|uniref:Uncharacterized protein n=1 Tax=Reichenbachiella faecimaris TaxID=692418 RepID=A0A1W2GI47_REIFA|nr:hypothetical protein [Reichenbachiella faecimaris]SMD36339.1 hypothetical protein SAMN04488029_2839 [Reichenbachiella faecimaris]